MKRWMNGQRWRQIELIGSIRKGEGSRAHLQLSRKVLLSSRLIELGEINVDKVSVGDCNDEKQRRYQRRRRDTGKTRRARKTNGLVQSSLVEWSRGVQRLRSYERKAFRVVCGGDGCWEDEEGAEGERRWLTDRGRPIRHHEQNWRSRKGEKPSEGLWVMCVDTEVGYRLQR